MLDVIVTALVITFGTSMVGFGALAAALAGPHRLVVVAVMLLMMMMASTNARSGLDL